MNKLYLLLLLAVIICGIIGYTLQPHFNSFSQLLLTLLQPILTQIEPIWTRINTAWTQLPTLVKTAIIGGVPTLLMMFFAWTKTRAMQKLQQTTTQVQQLENKTLQDNAAISTLEDAKQQLETEVETLQKQLTSNDTGQLLVEAQKLVTQKTNEIEKLKVQIDTLHRALAEKEQTVIIKEVVK